MYLLMLSKLGPYFWLQKMVILQVWKIAFQNQPKPVCISENFQNDNLVNNIWMHFTLLQLLLRLRDELGLIISNVGKIVDSHHSKNKYDYFFLLSKNNKVVMIY